MGRVTRLEFTDDRGRTWNVYDYSVLAGKTVYVAAGSGATYRGFAPVDGGARRTYMFRLKDDRTPLRENLERQLRASDLYHRDDPEECRAWEIAGQPPRTPERVDPPGTPAIPPVA